MRALFEPDDRSRRRSRGRLGPRSAIWSWSKPGGASGTEQLSVVWKLNRNTPEHALEVAAPSGWSIPHTGFVLDRPGNLTVLRRLYGSRLLGPFAPKLPGGVPAGTSRYSELPGRYHGVPVHTIFGSGSDHPTTIDFMLVSPCWYARDPLRVDPLDRPCRSHERIPNAGSSVSPLNAPDKGGQCMAERKLEGKKVAILAADMFERVELEEPRKALEEAGAATEVVSIHDGEIQGFDHFDPADKVKVDKTVEEASVDDYDALLIPGGVGNPDQLRGDENAVNFVREFFDAKKPMAVICHGPWMLVESGVVRGRKVTSWPTLQTDIRNAGGEWVDEEVVVDGGLVTSRKPDDIPAFNKKMIEEFCEGRHPARSAA